MELLQLQYPQLCSYPLPWSKALYQLQNTPSQYSMPEQTGLLEESHMRPLAGAEDVMAVAAYLDKLWDNVRRVAMYNDESRTPSFKAGVQIVQAFQQKTEPVCAHSARPNCTFAGAGSIGFWDSRRLGALGLTCHSQRTTGQTRTPGINACIL